MTTPNSEHLTSKERFAEHLRQGIDHLKEHLNEQTDNAVFVKLADATGMSRQTFWNWLNDTTLPSHNKQISFIKAVIEMTAQKPLLDSWYVELLKKGERKRKKIEVYEQQVRDLKLELEAKSRKEVSASVVEVVSVYAEVEVEATEVEVTEVNTRNLLGIGLGWWLVVGWLPLLSLIVEFGGGHGIYLARVYPHLFFQPLFFGPLLGIGAAALIQMLNHHQKLPRVLLICTIIGIATTLPEVFTGDTAIWEISPSITLTSQGDQDSHFDRFYGLLTECQGEPLGACSSAKTNYGNQLRAYSLDIKNSSLTRWFYMLSVFLYISTICLFVLVADLLRRERVQPERDETSFSNLGTLCGWSMVIISLWFPLRLAVDVLKRSLYPDANSIPTITLLILLVVICGYFLLTFYDHPTTVWLFAITLSIIACSIYLFFAQPTDLVSIAIGTLLPTGFTENLQVVISKYSWPLIVLMIFSWQQVAELMTGKFRLWGDSFDE